MKKFVLLLTIIILAACQPGQDNTVHIKLDCEFNGAPESFTGRCPIFDLGPLVNGTPLSTSAISATPTQTPAPSATAAVPTSTPVKGVNLFKDPGFEGPYTDRPNIDGYKHTTPHDWNPFYCDGCQAYRIGTGNPTGLLLGRPEYKPAWQDQDPLRIHSGKGAAEWFGFYRAIDGGLYQVVDTAPGASCTVSVYVQSWSGFDGDKDPHQSHLVTEDDKANSTWFILIDLSGGSRPYRGDLLSSRAFGYDDSIYDAWAKIEFSFVTTGTKTTIFFDNMRLWPARNNNNYLDDASMICDSAVQPTQAPTLSATPIAPTSAPVVTSTPIAPLPTRTPGSGFPVIDKADNVIYKTLLPVNVRTGYSTTAPITGSYPAGREVVIKCIIQLSETDSWGSTDACNILPAHWSAIRIGTTEYMRVLEEPQGR